jgi:gamma-glutamylcyclotransferase (GGCT)/AIG2-like uncharacterized protein YtfP
MAAVCRRLRHIGSATVRGGRLYDLGPYPAAVLDGSQSCLRGELVEVDFHDTWRELDQYEGCPRPGEGDGLFRRVQTNAVLASGEVVHCWIYVYNQDLSQARPIECGCWRTHRAGGSFSVPAG